jgi:hypothetical protein
MRHLSESEIVDLVDGTLAPARAAHLEACDACRTTANGLRDVLAQAADAAIPEPSPLFWDHFSARVGADVRSADAAEPSGWFGWAAGPTVKWAMAGALLTILLVSGVWLSLWRTHATAPGRVPPVTTATASAGRGESGVERLDADSPENDEAWALVRSVADDLTWDDAAEEGLGVRPEFAERALAALTRDERSELVRLLAAETKQPGA